MTSYIAGLSHNSSGAVIRRTTSTQPVQRRARRSTTPQATLNESDFTSYTPHGNKSSIDNAMASGGPILVRMTRANYSRSERTLLSTYTIEIKANTGDTTNTYFKVTAKTGTTPNTPPVQPASSGGGNAVRSSAGSTASGSSETDPITYTRGMRFQANKFYTIPQATYNSLTQATKNKLQDTGNNVYFYSG